MTHQKSKLNAAFTRFKTPILYALFGTGTSVLNYGIFFLGTQFVPDPNVILITFQWWEVVNISAWIIANIYSFYVNRRFVFKTKGNRKTDLLREVAVFFGVRLISFFISSYIMSIFINAFNLDHNIAKLLGVTIEIVINYFTCKWFIFKKQN